MKTSVYNQQGQEIKKIELPENIFGLDINEDLVHQVVVCQMSNRRQNSAHTKDRSEVSGGGKKPWRQKGTGRARHGSIRSPLWKGGGVTFGPRNEKNYKKNIPNKMRKKALFMVLSGKLKDNQIIFVDNIKIEKTKTKEVQQIINNLPINNKKALIVLPEKDNNLVLGARNINNIETVSAKDINALDLLSFTYLIVLEESIKVIEKTFL